MDQESDHHALLVLELHFVRCLLAYLHALHNIQFLQSFEIVSVLCVRFLQELVGEGVDIACKNCSPPIHGLLPPHFSVF